MRAIAEAHGGRVELASAPGAGATFTVVMPTEPPEELTPMSRILIAEDEPRIASFLEKGLRANGFSDDRRATTADARPRWPATATSTC